MNLRTAMVFGWLRRGFDVIAHCFHDERMLVFNLQAGKVYNKDIFNSVMERDTCSHTGIQN